MTDAAGDFAPGPPRPHPAGGTLGDGDGVRRRGPRACFLPVPRRRAAGGRAAGGYVVQFDTDATRRDGTRPPLRPRRRARSRSSPTAPTAPVTLRRHHRHDRADERDHRGQLSRRRRRRVRRLRRAPGAPERRASPPARPWSSARRAATAPRSTMPPPGWLPATADVLGTAKGRPRRACMEHARHGPAELDSDGDGFIDRIDNCPVGRQPRPGGRRQGDRQQLPPDPGVPDGTEGHGNACDATPRGYDLDHDDVGLLDDLCGEQYGLDPDGCPAQSTTGRPCATRRRRSASRAPCAPTTTSACRAAR